MSSPTEAAANICCLSSLLETRFNGCTDNRLFLLQPPPLLILQAGCLLIHRRILHQSSQLFIPSFLWINEIIEDCLEGDFMGLWTNIKPWCTVAQLLLLLNNALLPCYWHDKQVKWCATILSEWWEEACLWEKLGKLAWKARGSLKKWQFSRVLQLHSSSHNNQRRWWFSEIALLYSVRM